MSNEKGFNRGQTEIRLNWLKRSAAYKAYIIDYEKRLRDATRTMSYDDTQEEIDE